MVTIRDVAERAGVSMSTVSHVINNTRRVDPATEQRVQAAIRDLGYRPNTLARGLRRRETHTIGLIVPDNSNPFFADIARVIEDLGFAKGYNVILCNSDGSEAKEAAYFDVLVSKRVDGLILISLGSRRPDSIRRLMEARMPVVVVDRELPDVAVDQVLVDNEQGGYLAGRHLVELGHRRIGCITGPSDITPSAGRVQGFRRALDQAGIVLAPEAVVRGDFRYTGGEEGMRELLRRGLDLTAVFAANDVMAVGALSALRRAHVRVPDDLSIIGFDNIALAEAVSPTVTTIAQPITELGRWSITLLLERIRERSGAPSRIMLPTTLVERESCRALPSAVREQAKEDQVHMKAGGVLNRQLSHVIASMGHTDMLVVADAGLPIPPDVACIDLAVTAGIPAFMDVARAIALELEVERMIVADELLQRAPHVSEALGSLFPRARQEAVPHEQFKALTARARAVVRTGECTPYHNVILCSGVVF